MNLAPGTYNLKATPWSGLNRSGSQGISHELTFRVVENARTCLTNNYSQKASGSVDDTGYNMKVFPNPNQGEFSVELNLEESSEIEIALYDLKGKAIYRNRRFAINGNYIEKISLTPHAVGIYFLSVNVNGIIRTEKILYTSR